MEAQRLYDRYHGLIVTMAEQAKPQHATKDQLQGLLARFDREAAALPANSVRWLRNELAEQLEQRLLRSTNAQAREVFSLASKHFE